VFTKIQRIQQDARRDGFEQRPRWPMIVLRTPKGWTGPKVVDGKQVEGTFHAHQVPMADMDKPGHIKILERWMKSYKPNDLFDKTGRLHPVLAALAPIRTPMADCFCATCECRISRTTRSRCKSPARFWPRQHVCKGSSSVTS